MKRSWLLVPVLALFAMMGCLAGVYYTNVPPPPDRMEVVGVVPGPEFVWMSGYWGWSGGAHVWVPGRWVRPPHPRAVWVKPRWEKQYGRYYFHEGRWR